MGRPRETDVREVFNLAEAWGLRKDGANPCRFVEKYKEHKRERFLTGDEFHRLGQVLSEAEGSEALSAVTAIRLLMLTGCRLGEIQTLRWENVDLKAGELRLPDSKTGARMVPLSRAAAGVLDALPRDPDNPWVIAGRKQGSRAPPAPVFRSVSIQRNDSLQRTGTGSLFASTVRTRSGCALLGGACKV